MTLSNVPRHLPDIQVHHLTRPPLDLAAFSGSIFRLYSQKRDPESLRMRLPHIIMAQATNTGSKDGYELMFITYNLYLPYIHRFIHVHSDM